MLIDGILFVLYIVFETVLSPLTVLNIGVDFLSGLPVFAEFIQVVGYVLPMANLMPIVFIIVALFGIRIFISLIKTLWDLIPFL